jgi:hypothetical protein
MSPDHPHLRTRYRTGRTVAEWVDVLRRLAIVDLVGVVIEGDPLAVASASDRQNARDRIEQVVAIEGGGRPTCTSARPSSSGRTVGASSAWHSRCGGDAGDDSH